jgi:hypothetical protein
MAERDLVSVTIQLKTPTGVREKTIWLKGNEPMSDIVGVIVQYGDHAEKVWPRAMAIRNRVFAEPNDHAFRGRDD